MATTKGKDLVFKLSTDSDARNLVDLTNRTGDPSGVADVQHNFTPSITDTPSHDNGMHRLDLERRDFGVSVSGQRNDRTRAYQGKEGLDLAFELGPDGDGNGSVKFTGLLKIQSYQSTHPYNGPATFSMVLVVNGVVTEGTY